MTPQVLIVAPGDPRDPRTWSGTAHHLVSELDTRGALAGTMSTVAATPKWARVCATVLSNAYYGAGKLHGYGRFTRHLKGSFITRAIEATGAPAVLHLQTTHLPLASTAGRTKHYLYIDTSQRLWTRYSGLNHKRSGRLETDVHRLEKQSFFQMHHIFSVSEYLREDLITHYGVSPTKVTAVGTGLGKIQPWHGPKDYQSGKMLYVGVGWDAKGGQLALDAFIIAQQQRPTLRLTMVCEPAVQRHLAELNVPGLEPLSQIEWKHLEQLYRDATLFVMPAVHQPWGLAYLEALSCATPIVGLDRLSTPELTGHGNYGWSLKSPDPAELARVMIEAHDHPAKLEEMGRAGQAFCLERFSWSQTMDRMMNRIIHDDDYFSQ